MILNDRIKKSKENIKETHYIHTPSELVKLYEQLEQKRNDKSFLLTIPIHIVASNESFFKESFSSIINSDEMYLTSSKSLIKRTKIEIEDVFQITKSSFSIGDLISYSLKYSSIENIFSQFIEITKIDIYKELNQDFLIDVIEQVDLEDVIPTKSILGFGKILKNLKEVYEIRNVICHDFLSTTHKLELSYEKISQYLLDNILLQFAFFFLCSEKIYEKLIPIDDLERKNYFQLIIDEKENKLTTLYNELKESFDSKEKLKNFKKNINQFNSYMENECENIRLSWFNGSEKENEQDFPFILSHHLEYKIKLLNQRINNIQGQIYLL
ncbi:MAG: hypothetical protein WAW57_14530 [Lutibacter sp.]